MAKTPNHAPHEDEPQSLLADDVGRDAARPGPDETPVDIIDHVLDPPDPAVFAVPAPVSLTKPQIGGLQREGLEAYLFGRRVRHDWGGRRWDFNREAADGVWSLIIRVQIGPLLLAKAGITLDRLPSAEGEHRLLALVEAMAAQAAERQGEARAIQQKRAKAM